MSSRQYRNDQQQGENSEEICFLTYGFERPTPEIMAAWNTWFEINKGQYCQHGGSERWSRNLKSRNQGFANGTKSITGFMIMSAESLEDAERMAQSNPYVTSIRVYEMMSK